MSYDQKHAIADLEKVHQLVHRLKGRSDEIKARLAPVLKGLWDPERIIKGIDPELDFQGFRARFPQFSQVIEFVEESVVANHLLESPFTSLPILLTGDPGLGKTYFAKELADFIGLPFYEVSMATSSASFVLAGGSLQWSEGSVGAIATHLANSKEANPVILIDEVDKCTSSGRFNAMNVLYGLLEPHTASRFKDEALELEMDAGQVFWICTANNTDLIPEPIKSRLQIFHIKSAKPAEMRSTVKRMYSDMLSENKSMTRYLSENLDEPVLEALSKLTPREIRLALKQASFRSIRHGYRTIPLKFVSQQKKEMRHVGFI